MGTDALEKVDWTLPGMERFDEADKRWITRSIVQKDIVNSICCLGWALWPTSNRGYYDEYHLRKIADFLEIQNKPFWDEYEAYCATLEPLTDQEIEDMKCLEELGFMPIPTSTTKECVDLPAVTEPS